MKFYLDTSAWVKRYLVEEGTHEVDDVFNRATSGGIELSTSIWNIGECLGIFDKRRLVGDLNHEQFEDTLEKFFRETIDLAERGNIELSPISGKLLSGAWEIVLENHIYQADALQIQTMRARKCDVILTGDKQLTEIAETRGYEAVCLEEKENRMELKTILETNA